MRRVAIRGASIFTIAGGAVVGVPGSAGATSSFSISYLAGPSRFQTASIISTTAYPKGAATVILADGLADHVSDSLAASYLAGQLNGGAGAPILLSEPNTLPPQTLDALRALHTTNIIVAGGSAAVSDAVIATLVLDKFMVTRVAGTSRFTTALALDTVAGETMVGIAASGTPAASTTTTTSSTGTTTSTTGPVNPAAPNAHRLVIVADGQDANLVDSLGAAPVAFAEHSPILLVNGSTGELSPAQIAFLKAADPSSGVLIVGGSGAVGAQVTAQVSAAGESPISLAGADRSSTSVALAYFATHALGFSTSTFDVASGDPAHLIDSLAGGPYGGTRIPPAPTLVTVDVNNPGVLIAFVTQHASTEVSAIIFGGSSAVSPAIKALLAAAGQ